MITLATSQASLMQSPSVGMVTLVHLTTYTNRTTLAVSKEFWFSTPHPIRYKWGGAPRDFWDVIDSVTFSGDGFDHLPSPGNLRGSTARLDILAETVDGENLWKTLSAQSLHRAKVEIATLLVNPAQYQNTGTAWWDLTALAGTEHVIRFRGVLSGSAEISDEIVRLEAFSDDQPLQWLRLTDPTYADPRDLGRRFPIPFGAVKGLPLVNAQVGWASTLAQSLSATQTGHTKCSDLSGSPSGSATYQIGSERVTATKVDSTTLNITGRGVGGTIASIHNGGEPIGFQFSGETTIVVSGVPIDDVDKLYVINQSTGEKILVTTPYRFVRENAAITSGKLVSTIQFYATEWQQLMDLLEPSVSTQPTLSTALCLCSSYTEQAGPSGSNATVTVGSKLIEASASQEDLLRATVNSAADIPDPESRVIKRWRVKVNCTGRGHDNTDVPPTDMEMRYTALGSSTSSWSLLFSFNNGAAETIEVNGPWITPSTSKTLADALNGYVEIRIQCDGPDETAATNYVQFSTIQLECEVEETTASYLAPDRGPAQGGFGMLFVADVRGVTVPKRWDVGYNFNTGTGWEVSGGTHADMTTGQKITATAGATLGILQRNATAETVDFSTDQLRYRIQMTATNVHKIESITLQFENTAGSGTTEPTKRRELGPIYSAELVEGVSTYYDVKTVTDFLSPSYSNCETIRAEIVWKDTATGDLPSVTFWEAHRRIEGGNNADWGSREAGTLLTDGNDIARWFIEEYAREQIDSTSFSDMGTALESLNAGEAFAGQYDALGDSLGQVLAGLGFNMRTNFRRSPVDGRWHAYTATNTSYSYSYPSTVRALSTLDTLRESLKDLVELAHRFRGFYNLMRWKSPSSLENYSSFSEATSADALAAIGDVDAEPIYLVCIGDSNTAADVLSMYRDYRGSTYNYRRWSVTVPIWDAYDLEPGDTVSLRPRWRTSDAKARVLEVLLAANEAAVGLVLEEVR